MAVPVGLILQVLGPILASIAAEKGLTFLGNRSLGKQLDALGPGARMSNTPGFADVPVLTNGQITGTRAVPFKPKMGAYSILTSLLHLIPATAMTVAPYAFSAAGKAAKVTGHTAGAVSQALANMPRAVAGIGNSDAKRQLYGKSVSDAAGEIFHGMGNVGNVAGTTIGSGVDEWTGDMSRYIQMHNLEKRSMNNMIMDAQRLQALGLNRGVLDFLQRRASMYGMMGRKF